MHFAAMFYLAQGTDFESKVQFKATPRDWIRSFSSGQKYSETP